MIKLKEKEVKENYKCYSIGYCEAQDLLSLEGVNFYTAGVYGWNADIYIFGNTAIVTGYRPFGESLDFDIVNKYNKKPMNTEEQIIKATKYKKDIYKI